MLAGGRPDEDAHTLEIPSDGSVAALRALPARLDDHSIDIAEITVHIPDLDDVFLTLTGTPRHRHGHSQGAVQPRSVRS